MRKHVEVIWEQLADDDEFVMEYLLAAREQGPKELHLAIQDVVDSREG